MNATVKAHAETSLRARLCEEATRLFAQRGFAGTSTRDIVEACGCTKPALYYHFPSKEKLFCAVVEHHAARIGQLLSNTLAGDGSVRARLRGGVDDLIDYCADAPLVLQLMQRIEVSPEDTAPSVNICESRAKHLKMLSELVAIGMKSGELRAELLPDEVALAVAGIIHFQLEQSIASGTWDRARIHRTLDLLFDGLAK